MGSGRTVLLLTGREGNEDSARRGTCAVAQIVSRTCRHTFEVKTCQCAPARMI